MPNDELDNDATLLPGSTETSSRSTYTEFAARLTTLTGSPTPRNAVNSITTSFPGADSNSVIDSDSETAGGVQREASRRFRILRPYAQGGLGKVSVARDPELNREVAFKEIRIQYADDESARTRFLLEAEVTGGLEHPTLQATLTAAHDNGTFELDLKSVHRCGNQKKSWRLT